MSRTRPDPQLDKYRKVCNVRPRYSAGSPGTVDASTALQVAREEWGAYQSALGGLHGPQKQAEAQRQGIGPRPVPGLGSSPYGIVERVYEHVGHWMVIDVFTGQIYRREFDPLVKRKVDGVCSRCERVQEVISAELAPRVVGMGEMGISIKKPPVLVFGSNKAGIHGAGAALAAKEKWGAVPGVGEGRRGNSYALPTKDERIRTMPIEEVADAVKRFLEYAEGHPDDTFLVSRVGCGLAGFTDAQIAPMFRSAPSNCWLPMGWGLL